MAELKLTPRTLRLLERITTEGEMRRDQFSRGEGCLLISLLRADLIRYRSDGLHTMIRATKRGRQIVADKGVDSPVSVEVQI